MEVNYQLLICNVLQIVQQLIMQFKDLIPLQKITLDVVLLVIHHILIYYYQIQVKLMVNVLMHVLQIENIYNLMHLMNIVLLFVLQFHQSHISMN